MRGIRFVPASPTLEETALECEFPLLSLLFDRDMLGLDVGDVGVSVKCITDSDNVCLISDGVLDDGFRRGLCVYGSDGAKQSVGFLWAGWCPTERTEQVILYDGAVERLAPLIFFTRLLHGSYTLQSRHRRGNKGDTPRGDYKCCQQAGDPETAGKCEKDNEGERQTR